MAILFDYVVVIEAAHPRDSTKQQYVVPQSAYSISDAIMQTLIELDAQYALFAQQYTTRVLSVRPDSEKALAGLDELLKAVGFAAAPTIGRTS